MKSRGDIFKTSRELASHSVYRSRNFTKSARDIIGKTLVEISVEIVTDVKRAEKESPVNRVGTLRGVEGKLDILENTFILAFECKEMKGVKHKARSLLLCENVRVNCIKWRKYSEKVSK